MLREEKHPVRSNSSGELQRMKNRGCYIDEVTIVDGTWTYEQTTAKLAQWFPRVATYVHGRKLDQVVSKDGNILPWWRLLSKSGYSLDVVEAAYPTGTDLVKNKGRDKAGINDSQLWFGTYLHISIIMIATDLGLFISHQKPH